MAYCVLFIAPPIWAERQEDPSQDEQFQEDQSQIVRPKHKPKPFVHRIDPGAQLRQQMRDNTNNGLVGIVSEGSAETVDMTLALTAQAEHDRLRLLPIAGVGASQNAKDVMLT